MTPHPLRPAQTQRPAETREQYEATRHSSTQSSTVQDTVVLPICSPTMPTPSGKRHHHQTRASSVDTNRGSSARRTDTLGSPTLQLPENATFAGIDSGLWPEISAVTSQWRASSRTQYPATHSSADLMRRPPDLFVYEATRRLAHASHRGQAPTARRTVGGAR